MICKTCQLCNNEPVIAVIKLANDIEFHIGMNCLLKKDWRQKGGHISRHCIHCGRNFKCYGECKDEEKIKGIDNCYCGKCGKCFLGKEDYHYKCESRFGDKAEIKIGVAL